MIALTSSVGWMTLFSSTVIGNGGGGWVERHPPYGAAPFAQGSISVASAIV